MGLKYSVFNQSVQQEIYYHINDFFQILGLLRFAYFLSALLDTSVWKSRSAHRICKLYGCEGGARFTFKALMKVNPSGLNALLFGVTIMLFALALKVAESPIQRLGLHQQEYNFINSLWAVTMTMTTGKLLFYSQPKV